MWICIKHHTMSNVFLFKRHHLRQNLPFPGFCFMLSTHCRLVIPYASGMDGLLPGFNLMAYHNRCSLKLSIRPVGTIIGEIWIKIYQWVFNTMHWKICLQNDVCPHFSGLNKLIGNQSSFITDPNKFRICAGTDLVWNMWQAITNDRKGHNGQIHSLNWLIISRSCLVACSPLSHYLN